MKTLKPAHELPEVTTSHADSPHATSQVILAIRNIVLQSFALQEKVTGIINDIRITVYPESLGPDSHEHSIETYVREYEQMKERALQALTLEN